MKILISNDDGIGATGIETLYQVLKSKSIRVTLVAPHQERSSCGHGITLHEPLRVNELAPNYYDCSGTPADCILLGLGHICKDDRPDLVVSGINNGANLGQDRYYSGTIAAARESSFRGIPSIAVSLVINKGDETFHFETAAKFVKKLIEADIHQTIPSMSLLNINVPNIPAAEIAGAKITFPGFQEYSEEVLERSDFKGKKYFWIGGIHQGFRDIKGSDCNLVADKYIALNLQNFEGKECNLDPLKAVLEKLGYG